MMSDEVGSVQSREMTRTEEYLLREASEESPSRYSSICKKVNRYARNFLVVLIGTGVIVSGILVLQLSNPPGHLRGHRTVTGSALIGGGALAILLSLGHLYKKMREPLTAFSPFAEIV